MNRYLEVDQFEALRPAPNADTLWPILQQGEVVVLDANMMTHHAYILCESIEEAKEAIQSTLYSTLSQRFNICRLTNQAPQDADASQ